VVVVVCLVVRSTRLYYWLLSKVRSRRVMLWGLGDGRLGDGPLGLDEVHAEIHMDSGSGGDDGFERIVEVVQAVGFVEAHVK